MLATPPNLRGGQGALMLPEICFESTSYSSVASRQFLFLRVGVDNQHFIIQLGVKTTHFNASTLVSINLVTEDIQSVVSGWVTRGEDEI